MWRRARAHFSENWPIYRQGLAGIACTLLLWGAFELFQQNLELFGLGESDPAVITMGWLLVLFACYGHFAGRILREAKRKHGPDG
ncbi:hypothetical protein [Pseudoduganella sp. R-43]|uniref:hypothetical protein n=1 Tax=Pseudoduganella sp. R-43 TaxID=3404063 RepID=UPI003CF66BE8